MYIFSFKCPYGKSYKELNQVNELATQQGHLWQSSSKASYGPNIFSRDEKKVLEHHTDEKCSQLEKMQNRGNA